MRLWRWCDRRGSIHDVDLSVTCLQSVGKSVSQSVGMSVIFSRFSATQAASGASLLVNGPCEKAITEKAALLSWRTTEKVSPSQVGAVLPYWPHLLAGPCSDDAAEVFLADVAGLEECGISFVPNFGARRHVLLLFSVSQNRILCFVFVRVRNTLVVNFTDKKIYSVDSSDSQSNLRLQRRQEKPESSWTGLLTTPIVGTTSNLGSLASTGLGVIMCCSRNLELRRCGLVRTFKIR